MSDERLLIFDVDGEPAPQGSMTPYYQQDRKTKKPIWTRDGRLIMGIKASNEKALKAWRKRVAAEAEAAMLHAGMTTISEKVSLAVEVHFFMPRPDAEWGTGRNARWLKPGARAAPVVYPDVDKLLRAILDAITGVVYSDDAIVTRLVGEEHYAVPNGTEHEGQGVTIVVLRRAAQTALDLPENERVRWVPERVEDPSQLALTP